MSFLSPLVTGIAINDVDLAIKGLKALTNPKGAYFPSTLKVKKKKNEPEKNNPSDLVTWAHYLCTYTRFVYLNIVQRRCPGGRIKREVIPLFKIVVSLIGNLEKLQTFGIDDKRELDDFKKNVNTRIKLSQGYIKATH